jgi:hypothetical protein
MRYLYPFLFRKPRKKRPGDDNEAALAALFIFFAILLCIADQLR